MDMQLRLESILKEVNLGFPGMRLEHDYEGEHRSLGGRRWFLRVVAPEGSPWASPEMPTWAGRKWRLSPHMTNGEIVQTAFKALLTCLEHEARERFTYKGVPVLSPHWDIDVLVTAMSRDGSLQRRP
jgi:hypothetical protein